MANYVPDFAIQAKENMLVASAEDWDKHIDIVGELDVVYVYVTEDVDEFGHPLPLFKVGDGNAYLIDMAFNKDLAIAGIGTSDKFRAHLNAENLSQIIFG